MSRTRLLAAMAALGLSACADVWGFKDLSQSAGGAAGAGGDTNGGGGSGRGGSIGTGGKPGTGQKVPTPDASAGGAAGSGGSSAGTGGSSAGTGGSSPGTGGMPGTGGQVEIDAAAPDGPMGTGGAAGGGGSGGMAGTGGQGGSGGLTEGGAEDGAAGTGGREAGGTGGVPDGGGCVGITHELLTNGSFEQGETGWAVTVAGGFPIVFAADGHAGTNMPEIAAQSPPNLAWIGGYDRADDSLTQSITFPAGATSMTLSFFYSIFTRETASVESDVFDVSIVDGTQTLSLAHFSNLDVVETWTRRDVPLPSNLAGRTVSLGFHGATSASLISSFYIDTVSLSVVTCP